MYVEDLTGKMAKKRPHARTLRKHCVRKGSKKAAMCKKAVKKRLCKDTAKATAYEKVAKATVCESGRVRERCKSDCVQKVSDFLFFEMGLQWRREVCLH